ncbi:hypothetical protein FISHEDRAFT_59482 [Fistulina hepatica ATCC 64428]|uniref:Uncharacterized protein n=1 Tax=Fistulina hepatica ATCC 64428 TaxID=1128425 RepID=A0A0D7A9W6_9AGAR|nr:hypothetical protein FISHEDRAFT_59482 [Fistulina hepatica ATCC 64428]
MVLEEGGVIEEMGKEEERPLLLRELRVFLTMSLTSPIWKAFRYNMNKVVPSRRPPHMCGKQQQTCSKCESAQSAWHTKNAVDCAVSVGRANVLKLLDAQGLTGHTCQAAHSRMMHKAKYQQRVAEKPMELCMVQNMDP